MSDPPVEMPFNKDTVLGALLIGGLVSAILWSTACSQVLSYYRTFQGDAKLLRVAVPTLLLIDTFDLVLSSHALYWYLIINFDNQSAILKPVWSTIIHVAVTSSSNFIVRSLFVRRVWNLSSGNYTLCGLIMIVSMMDLVCGIAITIQALPLSTFAELPSIYIWFYIDFASIVVGDTIVALSLCHYLQQSRPRLGRIGSIIDVLMVYTISTGLVTAVNAAAGLICYVIMPKNFIFLAFYLILSKLYLNAYLASLNARVWLREQGNNVCDTINLNTYPAAVQGSLMTSQNNTCKEPSFNPGRRQTIEIQVHRKTEHDSTLDFGPA